MDSRESILVWNRYAGAKMKFKRLCGLPDRYFNPFLFTENCDRCHRRGIRLAITFQIKGSQASDVRMEG
jgi:hypothetical protein